MASGSRSLLAIACNDLAVLGVLHGNHLFAKRDDRSVAAINDALAGFSPAR
jgi:hypothetical protein